MLWVPSWATRFFRGPSLQKRSPLSLGAESVLYETNIVQKEVKVESKLIVCCSLAGGRPKAPRKHWFGGRPMARFVSGGHVYGRRPKAAIDHVVLRRAAEGRPRLHLEVHCKRSLTSVTQLKTFVFTFRLARLWRALISSIYIFVFKVLRFFFQRYSSLSIFVFQVC